MTVSKEILHITLILLPGIVSFLITEALIPHKQAEFNRSVIYVITLSAMSFLISLGIWNFYSYLSIKLKFAKQLPFLELKENIFSFHSNYEFAILVFFISMVIGLFFAWAINNKIIYKFMNQLGASNMNSDLEVWDDFFQEKRENAFVVIRDIKNDIMYYGSVKYYSTATAKMIALYLVDIDVFINSSSEKLYHIQELYLPFNQETMTIEFPDFKKSKKD